MAQVLPAPSTIEEQASFQPNSLLRRSSSQPSLYIDTSSSALNRSHSSTPSLHAATFEADPLSTDDDDDGDEDQDQDEQDDSPEESPDALRLTLSRTSSFHSTPPSSISLDMHYAHPNADDQDDDDDDLQLPMFGNDSFTPNKSNTVPLGSSNDHGKYRQAMDQDDVDDETDDTDAVSDGSDPDLFLALPADDTQVKQEPSRQVDYLSHEWREEDIWESWKHIVSRRKIYGDRSRLENASWRTWAKQKYRLKTVSPETLNWLKDCDVTWLYGPLQEGKHGNGRCSSEAPSRLSKSNSFLNKKPILKKRSVSEEMLQKSLSSSSLIKQAAAAVQAQRRSGSRTRSSDPGRLRRTASDVNATPLNTETISHTLSSARTVSSSTNSRGKSPDHASCKRHIRFDNNVEQCIAVDFKDFTVEDENNPEWARACSEDSDSDDDNLPTIKTRTRKRSIGSTPASSRNSFSEGNTGIAKLPSTTLKVEVASTQANGSATPRRPMLSPSPSQETIRPVSKRSSTFMFGDDEDDDEFDWEPSGAFGSLRIGGSASAGSDGQGQGLSSTALEEGLAAKGMRRTPSGMFMPLDESEDEDAQAPNGIFGRVVDTVNTARDIAYVLYNVGWRR